MKQPKVKLLLAILLSATLSCGDGKEGTITGNLDHAGNKTIYLAQVTQEGERVVDSVVADSKGRFELANPADSMDFYVLRTDDANVIYLVLSGGEQVVIKGDARSLEPTYTVKGSADSELLRLLRNEERNLTDSLNKAYTSWREGNPSTADSVGAVLEQLYTDRMHAFANSMVSGNLSSIVSLSATKFLDQDSDLPLLEALLDTLQMKYPGNPYVTDFSTLVSGMKRFPVGSPAPQITLKTPEGQQLSLDAFKGKVLLVDFWASWCGPCRRANPELVSIYKRFKSPHFEILGVSLDDNADDWKAAIQKDQLTWPQVSELKGWESACASDYMIEAIPYSVLLDEEGRVIAKGLRPDELEPAIMQALRKKS